MKKLILFLCLVGVLSAIHAGNKIGEGIIIKNHTPSDSYRVEKVTFQSKGENIVGNLFIPERVESPPVAKPALVIIGPVAYVKEQAPLQYATRMARSGFVVLIFDPRYHGESGGEPRRFESGRAKVEDIRSALDFLSERPFVDKNRIFALGICQGVNWMIEATTLDRRIKALSIVAGHYLTPETANMYLGGPGKVAARIKAAKVSRKKFEERGVVEYIPIVSESDKNALLLPRPIYQWYIPWANRGLFQEFRGQWENRVTRMSEAEIWSKDISENVTGLQTPTLMIHADRAASGKEIPRKIFGLIPTRNKKLVWLGNEVQFQFYENPVTIDTSVRHITNWFLSQ